MSRLVFGRPGVVLPAGAYARLRAIDSSTVAFESTYDAALVNAFKSQLPPAARRWDGATKRWLIDPAYAAHVADLCEQYLGVRPAVPALGASSTQPAVEQKLVRLEYLGRCKERAIGQEATAAGWADGAWSLVFGESVLRTWFEPDPEATAAPSRKQPKTLYGVLMVAASASADEIRTNYRRLARSTHPDVNKEPDAAEQFIAVKQAYDVLSNEQLRRRYDAGLAFEAQSRANDPYLPDRWAGDDAPPLRCGWVLVSGQRRLGQFVVSQILAWEDIVDARGRVMVSSWPAGGKHFETRWV